jgi:DNA transformation protein and related proteins
MKEMDGYCAYVLSDVLGHIDDITSKKMFGGYGLYYNGIIFGIITDVDELRFKVDDVTRSQYEERGSTPFVYTGHTGKKPSVMQYYLVPEEVQEDRELVEQWLLDAVAVSKRTKK